MFKRLLVLGVVLIVAIGLLAYFLVWHRPGTPPSSVASLETYNGCGVEGTAGGHASQALNTLKNRYAAPQPAQINPSITLAALLAPGDDSGRWSLSDAAEVVGYVWDVKPGGLESVNCDAADLAYRDTHIELVLDPGRLAATERVIVEVTPRWRAILAAQGSDWSTHTLRVRLLGGWVKVRGWMLFDWQHKTQAENTNPGHHGNWRATAWEIHPVTSIEVVTGPQ